MFQGLSNWIDRTPGNGAAYHQYAYLKDGAWVGFICGVNEINTIFPGETEQILMNVSQGRIAFDVNGDEEPNVRGKDVFMIPIGDDGILYSE